MGIGFEARFIESTGDFIKPVYETVLQTIDSLLDDPEFIRLAEWSVYGGFDDGGFIFG